MAKALKIIGVILAIIIILIGIGIFLIMHYVDPNKLKSEISTRVYNATGRHLTIKGKLSWSFFPWVGFKVGETDLSNASGFGDKPFLAINNADISVSVLPLLRGHIDVRNIDLNGVSINLMRNKQGATNWSDLVDKQSTPPTSNAQPPSATQPVPESQQHAHHDVNFSIANLTIVNSSLHWDDAQHNKTFALTNLYVDGQNVGTQKIFPITVNFKVNSNQLPKTLNVSLNGTFNIDKNLNNFAINQIDAKINQFELQGDVSAKNVDDKMSFQGDVHIAPTNLNDIVNLFNVKLPAMQNKNALSAVSTDLAFNGTNQSLSVKPLKIGIDKTNLTGNLSVSDFAKPKITFKLTANQLNLDNYMAPKSTATKADDADASNSSNPTAPATDTKINLPTEFLRQLNAQGSVSISQLIVHNLHTSSVDLTLSANGGLIQIKPLTASLYEGSLTANASLDVRGETPIYYFTSTLSKVQAEPLLSDFIGKDFISGTANFNSNLTTQGNSVQQLLSSLNGSSQFEFTNGTLKGVNVDYALAQAKAAINKTAQPAKPATKDTAFGQATATFNISNGVAQTNNLLVTNKALVGKGTGTADLNKQKLDIDFNVTTTQIPELKGYTIPLEFKGPLTSPNINLDTSNVLQQVLKNTTKSQVQKSISKNLGGLAKNKEVQNALNGLFGK
jgi:AsmA protein